MNEIHDKNPPRYISKLEMFEFAIVKKEKLSNRVFYWPKIYWPSIYIVLPNYSSEWISVKFELLIVICDNGGTSVK